MAFQRPDSFSYDTKFAIGDTVLLNSSSGTGPLMTVKAYRYTLGKNINQQPAMMYNGWVECTWFDEANKLQKSEFHQNMLHLAQPYDFNKAVEMTDKKASDAITIKSIT